MINEAALSDPTIALRVHLQLSNDDPFHRSYASYSCRDCCGAEDARHVPGNETANAVACGNGHNTSVETRDRRS